MRVVVVWSTDRWGEDPRVDAVFETMEKAQAFAEAETARTHGVARRDDWVLSARIFELDEFETDDVIGALNRVTVHAPAISDARVTFTAHPRLPLTIAKLREELYRFKIREDAYDLDGEGREPCYCLEQTPTGWVTFYRVDGARQRERFFDDESKACLSFLGWIFRDNTTHPDNPIRPAPPPARTD